MNKPTHEPQLDAFCDIADRIIGGSAVKTVVEIGARDCAETLAFASRYPQAQIYTLECNPETLPLCRERMGGKPNVRLIERAIADKNGAVDFYQIDTKRTKTQYPGGNPGASSLFPASGDYPLENYVQNKITVPAITLKALFKQERIESVDLMWMDIQGAELAALRGAQEDLARIKLIHLEVAFFEVYKNQPLFKEIKSFLGKNDFAFLTFTQISRYAGDAIFVRRDLDKRAKWQEKMTLWKQLGPRMIKNWLK